MWRCPVIGRTWQSQRSFPQPNWLCDSVNTHVTLSQHRQHVCTNPTYSLIYMKLLPNPIFRLILAHHGVVLLHKDNIVFEFVGLKRSSLSPIQMKINSSDTGFFVSVSVAQEGNEKQTCWHLNLFKTQKKYPYMLLAVYRYKNNSSEQFLMEKYTFTFYRRGNKMIHLLFFMSSLRTNKIF